MIFWGLKVNDFLIQKILPSHLTYIFDPATNRVKKSLTFGPQKITLKLIYGCFPLGGAEKAPPASNRVKKSLTFGPQKITLKLIYGRFPLKGAEKAPLCQIGLNYNIYILFYDIYVIFIHYFMIFIDVAPLCVSNRVKL